MHHGRMRAIKCETVASSVFQGSCVPPTISGRAFRIERLRMSIFVPIQNTKLSHFLRPKDPRVPLTFSVQSAMHPA